jgi:imidazoleglycerol phosphate dehydratase HisB
MLSEVPVDGGKVGAEFFGGLTDHARMCLHLHQLAGRNTHHIVEAAFKATASVAIEDTIKVTGDGIAVDEGLTPDGATVLCPYVL